LEINGHQDPKEQDNDPETRINEVNSATKKAEKIQDPEDALFVNKETDQQNFDLPSGKLADDQLLLQSQNNTGKSTEEEEEERPPMMSPVFQQNFEKEHHHENVKLIMFENNR